MVCKGQVQNKTGNIKKRKTNMQLFTQTKASEGSSERLPF